MSYLGRYTIDRDEFNQPRTTLDGGPVIVRNNWKPGEVIVDRRGKGYRVAPDGSLRSVEVKEDSRTKRTRRRLQAKLRKAARKAGLDG